MASQFLETEFDSTYNVYTDQSYKSSEIVLCLRCNRPLTNEKSRLARIGPKCARKLAYESRNHSYSIKTLDCQRLMPPFLLQKDNIPIKQISLYYRCNSFQKPSCKIGSVSLSAKEDDMKDNNGNYKKRSYYLPLLESIIYEIFECLPQPRIIRLQVQNQQLKKIYFSIY